MLGQQIDKLLAIDQTNPSKAVFLGDATQSSIGDTAACCCLKGLYPPLHAGGLLGVRVQTSVIPALLRGNLADVGINCRAERIEIPAASAGMTEKGARGPGLRLLRKPHVGLVEASSIRMSPRVMCCSTAGTKDRRPSP